MKYFYKDMKFEVPENVYYPREDSELLARILEHMYLKDKKALEIGCGCGLLSIIMAKHGAHVTAVDINKSAVEATKENAKNNNVFLAVFKSDMFEKVHGKFDFIVFNPPYLPTAEEEEDITYSGGTTGREYIEIFISYAPLHLKDDGHLLLIISSLTGENEVLSMLREANMDAYVVAKEKVPWEELIVIEAAKK